MGGFKNFENKIGNIASNVAASNVTTSIQSIGIDQIVENAYNEKVFSMNGIEELSAYMKEKGDIEPIRVWKRPDGKFEIISGHRRYRAHVMNGDKKIDAIVGAGGSEADVLSEVIMANVLARRLTPIEDARAMKLYTDKVLAVQRENGELSGKTKELLAQKWGMSASSVSRRLSLLKLIPEAQALLESSDIDFSVFLPLCQASEEEQERVVGEIVKGIKESPDYIQELTADTVKQLLSPEESEESGETKEHVPQTRVKSKTTKAERSVSALVHALEKEDVPEAVSFELTKKNVEKVKLLIQTLQKAVDSFSEE